MFGGTPSNLAISVMDRAKIEVIAGINLPMLIKLASLRQSESLERAVIGANSVVTRPIPPYCLAVGAPAKVVEYFGPPERRKEYLGSEGSDISR